MADELDAGLVDRVARRIRQSDAVRDTEYEPIIADVYRRNARAALAATGIPVSALNALARGEATVVPKKPDAEQENAGGAAIDHPSVFMSGPSHRGRRLARNTYEAMLAASPYAAKE